MHCFAARLFTSFSIVGFKKLNKLGWFNAAFINTRCYIPNQQQRCFSDIPVENLSDLTNDNFSETDEFDFESNNDVKEVDFEKIAGGDAEIVKYLKIVELELEMMRQNGLKAPKHLSVENWKRLIVMRESKTQRQRFIQYLWLNEIKRQHDKERKAINSKIFEEKKKKRDQNPIKFTTSSPMIYGLQHVTMFHRIYDTQINRHYNYKLLLASWFGPDIIFDCGYEPYMSDKDLGLTVKQILLAWSENREHLNPYHIVFCNINFDGEIRRRLKKLFPPMDEPDFPFFMTEDHYFDIYPKEKLVYLTPHSKEVLTEYNPEDIYIIGALADVTKSEPLSLAKAKKEGIRKARFPIDQFVHWGVGTKSLTINHCLAIMNNVKDNYNWSNAFLRHLPKRKVLGEKFTYQMDDKKQETYDVKSIREQYRRNLVYDLLMQQRVENKREEKTERNDDANHDQVS